MRQKVKDSEIHEIKRYYEVPSEKVQEWTETIENLTKQRDQYKQAYQHCVDDLIVLRANNKRLERQNAEQLALLKQFRKLIDYKLTLHQGSSMYREYRSKLDQLGVK